MHNRPKSDSFLKKECCEQKVDLCKNYDCSKHDNVYHGTDPGRMFNKWYMGKDYSNNKYEFGYQAATYTGWDHLQKEKCPP